MAETQVTTSQVTSTKQASAGTPTMKHTHFRYSFMFNNVSVYKEKVRCDLMKQQKVQEHQRSMTFAEIEAQGYYLKTLNDKLILSILI